MVTRPERGRVQAIRIAARSARRRRGATMVEFALVVPLAFFFFFTAFEFCRVAMIRHTVDNAVYEACREAVVPGSSEVNARRRAEEVLGTLGLNGTNITVTPSTIETQTPEVTVSIDVLLDPNAFVVPPQFTGGRVIQRSLTMRREVSGV
ncbi:pilus assembly protein [Roseiconus nitratireducens]|uniref:Pilus assembly protein n=2 Tax=Roseiconus nitratireducens TaxID=2605748 RepID=A0A5M6CZ73_9BACT|nr:pilus assembly protein [Roseiconus nitratireducens]